MSYLLDGGGQRVIGSDGNFVLTDGSGIDPYCQWVVLRDCAEVVAALAIPYCLAFAANGDGVSYWEIEGVCYSASPGVDLVVETDLGPGVTKVCDPTPVEACACYYLKARDPCNGNAVLDVGIRVDDAGGVASDLYAKEDVACYLFLASDAATTTVPGTILTGYTVTTSADPLCCPPMPCATLAHVNPATFFPSAITIDFTLKDLFQSNPGTGTPCTPDNLRCSNVHLTLTLVWNAGSGGWGDNADVLVCTWENPDFPGSFVSFYIREPLVRMVVPKDAFGDWNGNPCYWEIIFWDKMTNPATGGPACRVVMRRFTAATPEGGGYAVVSSAGPTCVSTASICYAGWADTYQGVTLAF